MTTKLPLRHLSVRVPWHDAGWNGTVCGDPINNASCLRLANIHERRDDAVEIRVRGQRLDDLDVAEHPPCLAERATFMANFAVTRQVRHPYQATSDAHRHFRPTPFRIPPYTAAVIPYRWMLLKEASEIAADHDIPFDDEAEAHVRALMGFNSAWVQDVRNQSALLDTFISAVEPERSLAFFYAKEVPHIEPTGRVLIGVGWVRGYDDVVEYNYEPGADRPTRSVLWERAVHHSLRPGTPAGGFLLPYHAALERAGDDPSFDPASVVVFAPDEAHAQFSYASEHVSHDQAIASLLAMIDGLQRAQEALGTDLAAEIRWAQDRMGELWKLRGPFPGLGAALAAFGIDHAHLFAYKLAVGLRDDEDPWPAVQSALDDPATLGREWAGRIGPTMARKMARLPGERRALLQLLARFDLSPDQARRFYVREERSSAGIDLNDHEILANPYTLYEADRPSAEPIPITMIDRGLHPDPGIAKAFPIPEPSTMRETQDPRRVRALMTSMLEDAASDGHTLLPEAEVVARVRALPVEPPCPIDGDLLDIIADDLRPILQPAELADGRPAHQLDRLADTRTRINAEVTKRVGAARRHQIDADWVSAVDDALPSAASDDEAEQGARQEKAAALAELAAARFAVLVGPAGTGKTTLLRALCRQQDIRNRGITLLAPTGKARVQLERGLGSETGLTARTIAQFLLPSGRYDVATGAYRRSAVDPAVRGGTVIIDEASMLTEEQLDAVLDNVAQIERLILVGDPRQLPPIGAGRPFVDIVHHLRDGATSAFPRVGPSYAELTITRRQRGTPGSEGLRHDIAVAQWFGDDAPTALADEAWADVASGRAAGTVRFEQWDDPTEVLELLQRTLVEEIDEISDVDDQAGFGAALGGTIQGEYVYFNRSARDRPGAGVACERWQVLSPIHATGAGVTELNRAIHRHFRADLIDSASNTDPRWRKIPQPMGPEGIVYGDKVMNTRNHRRKHHYPTDGPMGFVANGEIGMVVGPFRARGKKTPLDRIEVEFSTQAGAAYKFWRGSLQTDGADPDLELAYAITVHKAQGSEFRTTFLILPDPCRLLSRELVYTALTRHTHRVVVLHQGPLHNLLAYSSSGNSETARRYTNLLRNPAPTQVADGRYLEANLIHRTADGTLVRSKSEVIIADALTDAGIEFAYEQPFRGHDGTTRLPDFTIEDAATGEAFIWEHLGLLSDPEYERAWTRKKAWYEASGVSADGGNVGTLVVTEDDDRGGIDSAAVRAKVRNLFGP